MADKEDQSVSLNAYCSVCQAPEGSPCTIPTSTGRKEVRWFHVGRLELAKSKIVESASDRAEKMAQDWPVHSKLIALDGANQTVGKFIEWLSENGYTICTVDRAGQMGVPYRDENGDVTDLESEDFCYVPENRPVSKWIEEYFDIDGEVIEREKQQMIRSLSSGYL